jgi:hypothetical protein
VGHVASFLLSPAMVVHCSYNLVFFKKNYFVFNSTFKIFSFNFIF